MFVNTQIGVIDFNEKCVISLTRQYEMMSLHKDLFLQYKNQSEKFLNLIKIDFDTVSYYKYLRPGF